MKGRCEMANFDELSYPRPADYADYTCGHCGRRVGGFIIAHRNYDYWLMCPHCDAGTIVNTSYTYSFQYPQIPYGPDLEGLPERIEEAYNEVRRSMSARAFVGAELLCRRILMHVAVDKGATEGETFVSYIDHIENQGFITPPMKPWVDLIRQHGNEATHTLDEPDEERAKHTVDFTAELLRIVYTMDHQAKKVQKGGTP
jgi:DNA-directed RNA polymerase subunit RPC12/RpoP